MKFKTVSSKGICNHNTGVVSDSRAGNSSIPGPVRIAPSCWLLSGLECYSSNLNLQPSQQKVYCENIFIYLDNNNQTLYISYEINVKPDYLGQKSMKCFRGELQEMLTCSTTMYRTEAMQMHAMHTSQYPIRRARFLKS